MAPKVQQSKSSVPFISKDVLKFRVSQFLHSCRPNVVTENYLENYEVRAIRKIKAGQQITMSRYIGNDPVFCMNPLETRQWRLHQGNEVQQIVVRHSELNQLIADKKAQYFLGLEQFSAVLYDLDWNTNSYSNKFNSYEGQNFNYNNITEE